MNKKDIKKELKISKVKTNKYLDDLNFNENIEPLEQMCLKDLIKLEEKRRTVLQIYLIFKEVTEKEEE